MKIFKRKHVIPLYETTIHMFVVNSMQDMQTYINKIDKDGVDVLGNDGCVFQLMESNYDWCIVLVKDKISHNLIAHETFHLTSKILNTLSVNNEEAGAWLMGHLIDYIYSLFNKNEIPIKNR